MTGKQTSKISREAMVWIALMVMTGLSWLLSAWHGVISQDDLLNVALISIAFIKVRFILMYFMEVREGPFMLKLSCDAWLVFSALGLFAFMFNWI